jgi:predicted hydrocarbon binding protein
VNPSTFLLPPRVLGLFIETLNAEVGRDTAQMVLAEVGVSSDLLQPELVSELGHAAAAEHYAQIQSALRRYYGRGARGILLRIGRLLWTRMLETAPLSYKARIGLVKSLPPSLRRKPALELLAAFLRGQPGGVTVHTLDNDLMLVDHGGAASAGQRESQTICYTTLGLIQECLFWATGHEHDMEEVSCRANGGDACEFKIRVVP